MMTLNQKPTVLVTGGAGFIGGNLVHLLCAEGKYRVVNLDKLTYAGNLESLSDLSDNPDYRFVQGDIGNRELVRFILTHHEPAAVINLAAESHVDRSIVDAMPFLQTNVIGTANLLEEVRAYWGKLSAEKAGSFRFVHVSTDEVYGSLGDSGYFTEETQIQPNSPYSASKAASDHLVRAYHHTHGLPVVTTNCSNNYGPFQFPEKMIPLMILNAMEGKALPVYGDGGNIRDWLYVTDHCRALVTAMEKGKPGEVYNIGGNNEQKNIDLVHMICDLLDERLPVHANPQMKGKSIQKYSDLITFVKDRPGHDRRYAIDSSKIQRQLGWKPEVTFQQGIQQTVDWYLTHPVWVEHVRSGDYAKWIDRNYTQR
jgi:dTDP-glucose 4,6-dehydratase